MQLIAHLLTGVLFTIQFVGKSTEEVKNNLIWLVYGIFTLIRLALLIRK